MKTEEITDKQLNDHLGRLRYFSWAEGLGYKGRMTYEVHHGKTVSDIMRQAVKFHEREPCVETVSIGPDIPGDTRRVVSHSINLKYGGGWQEHEDPYKEFDAYS